MATGLTTAYICQQCGAESPKWQGKCHSCGEWNTLVEVSRSKKEQKNRTHSDLGTIEKVKIADINADAQPRTSTGFSELDRVLGGGIVPGSVILIGGEPGIGKSTLLLQIAAQVGGIYVTAEESPHQVKMRADRLGKMASDLLLLATNNIDKAIAEIISSQPQPPLVIIDSIQTVATDDLAGVPGSIGQVRECAHRIVDMAKTRNIPTLIISHVTKEGTIAGPKALEHVVDVVAYVEGQEHAMTRLVRSAKNRFGPVHEVGLFELRENGMSEITGQSELLSRHSGQTSGSVITVSMEGVRPIMIEVQALTTKTSFGLPRRTANGMDYNRLLTLVAVMAKRASMQLADQDIYTNISGGLRINEAALDLPVCLALASSMLDMPLPANTVAFGEVSLSGEIKPVTGQQKRLEQAAKLGYTNAITSDVASDLKSAVRLAFPQFDRQSARQSRPYPSTRMSKSTRQVPQEE